MRWMTSMRVLSEVMGTYSKPDQGQPAVPSRLVAGRGRRSAKSGKLRRLR